MDRECVTCGRPTNTGYLCQTCTDGLAKDLGDLPSLDADLRTTYARLSRIGRNVGGRSDVRPLPWDERAADARTALKAALVAIVRDLHDGAEGWPADNVASLVGWLLSRLDRIRRSEAADETRAEVHDLLVRGNAICSGPPLSIFAGPCQHDVEDQPCGAELYVDASWDERTERHRPLDRPILCPRCGGVTEAKAQREYLLASINDMLVGAALAAKLLTSFGEDELPSATIRKWKERGQLFARGLDREGHETYLVADIRALHEESRKRRAARLARRA